MKKHGLNCGDIPKNLVNFKDSGATIEIYTNGKKTLIYYRQDGVFRLETNTPEDFLTDEELAETLELTDWK